MDIRDIENADLGQVTDVADRWRRGGTTLCGTAGELRGTAEFPDWDGTAAEAMRHRVDSSTNRADVAGFRSTAVGVMTWAHTAVLAAAQGIVRAVLAAARTTGMHVSPDGTVRPGGDGAAGLLAAVPGPVGQLVTGTAAALTAVLQEVMQYVMLQDSLAGGSVAVACDIDRPPAVSPVEFSPGAVAELTRDPAQAAAGTAVFPATLDASLDTGKKAELTAAVTRARESLALRGLDPDAVGVGVMDLAGSPAVVVGDLAEARTVSTLVSGVGSSGSGAVAGTAAAAGRIAGPGHAVVAWHGYTAPGNLLTGALPGHAIAGAPALRSAQRQLRETTREDADLQIIAHSYGTTLTGTAASPFGAGLEADTLHILGSPGMVWPTADALNLHAADGHAEVHVRTEPGDLIGLATGPVHGIHGKDPASPLFGADSVDGDNGVDGRGGFDGRGGPVHRAWDAVTDGYLWLRGDLDTHSAYLSDEQVLEKLRWGP
ncbi:alpha/beta hydrolase [Corynebacterium nuruki]|uniref:alpha/beta hydrolase n=1 Tax=Corynebacterium nuruki TaxID=1032851 RepID=UPI0039BFC214